MELSVPICRKIFFYHRKSVRSLFVSGKVFPIPAMSRDDGVVGDFFVFLRVLRGNAFEVPIPAMSRDDGDLGDPLPLCHSERWRSARDGERGPPRICAA